MGYTLTHLSEVRNFLPKTFKVTQWDALEPWFQTLFDANPQSPNDFRMWLQQWNELSCVIEEDMAWRYIRMTCHTDDEVAKDAYNFYLQNIMPKQSLWNDKLQKKYAVHPHRNAITDASYRILDRSIENALQLFREENIPLQSEIYAKAQEFGEISGAMTVEIEGKVLTMQQAGALLEQSDRNFRESVWRKIQGRRVQECENLHALLDTLCNLRQQEAKNAGFQTYTEYKFKVMGRYDYSIQDCLRFHEAAETVIKPQYQHMMQVRREKLKIDALRPWDLAVDIYGDTPLKPFADGHELTQKAIEVFRRIRPELAEMIVTMREMGHLDLDSRPGKAPGGYNHPLAESGVPFVFMNAAGTHDDLNTMMHEAGHAFHSFLTHTLELNDFKHTPSEVAELASMSMELISSSHWDVFYPDPQELKRAKIDHLSQALTLLTWVATVDAFQHWLYANPGHSHADRENAWTNCYYRFHGHEVDWQGFEMNLALMWQKQMHIFEVPFYYIEYGIAQMGALGVWMNYLEDPIKGVEQYLEALRLGYTRDIPEIYAAAGVPFDFSAERMRTLMTFGKQQLEKLESIS
jgi:oligoendopeptidase F